MSKYFIEDSEVTRIEFDKEWVDIKSELTQSDLDFIAQSQFKVKSIDADTQKAEIDFTFGEMALLQRGVVAWSFPLPLTTDNISRLKNPYRNTVLKKLNELNTKDKPIIKN